jgi:hypothetical protein
MAVLSKLFRLAALSLLLSAAVDLLAVDMLGAFWQDKAAAQSELQGSCEQDGCFCCSGIAVPVQPVVLQPHLLIATANEIAFVFAPSIAAYPLLHPPRTPVPASS